MGIDGGHGLQTHRGLESHEKPKTQEQTDSEPSDEVLLGHDFVFDVSLARAWGAEFNVVEYKKMNELAFRSGQVIPSPFWECIKGIRGH
jgi:hypothetical protein